MTSPDQTIARIAHVFRQGSGAPACVETESGRLFVLKFAGSGSGVRGLLTEYLGLKIAQMLGVRAPVAKPLWLPADFPWQAGTDEFDDLVKRSAGWNLGVAFIANAEPVNGIDALSRDFLAALARVDALLENVDRTVKNPNLLRDADHKAWAIDFDGCFFVHRLIAREAAPPSALPANHLLAGAGLDQSPARIGDVDALIAHLDAAPDAWFADMPIARSELTRRLAAYVSA
ncbi:MAG: HipA family kinase [Hyphomonadaceae bacterium]